MNELPAAPEVSAPQRRVLDYLLARQARGEIAPTTREIKQALGIASQNSVIQFLRVLERKGLVRTLPGKARGVIAVSLPSEPVAHRPDLRSFFIDVPLYGEIRGEGSVDGSSPPQVTLPVYAPTMRLTHRSRPFAWRMRGDSMKDACIKDGDFVVFDAQCEPRPGDVVAVFLDGATTLKRYVVIGDQTYLKAENPQYRDLRPADNLKAQGVMVGLIRGADLL